ncbi:dihydrofolate reductase [Bombina bombina]|uniref:dihydrofolate reductase n=1 Tax=Bombina bombina TaxID=8345 RepID=UPI00235AC6D1|nr:dihydrofolate reductase [Bombina bombina]XP_053574736.1 dihydrofolate reductase [Bombina bombina]XP_053574737.1 dihydrofolate reductase [Bombina bombina]
MCDAEVKNGSKPIKLIAAACRNMGIGKNGTLPWNLPNEFKYFLDKITTVTQPGKKNLLVLGRISYDGLDEKLLPLPNTIIAVVSRSLSVLPKYASYICQNEEEMVKLASTSPLSEEIETIWILGGVECYRTMMLHPWCEHIYLTNIMAEFECDTFFPEFDRNVFKLQEKYPGVPSEVQEENGIQYVFQVYQRSTVDD